MRSDDPNHSYPSVIISGKTTDKIASIIPFILLFVFGAFGAYSLHEVFSERFVLENGILVNLVVFGSFSFLTNLYRKLYHIELFGKNNEQLNMPPYQLMCFVLVEFVILFFFTWQLTMAAAYKDWGAIATLIISILTTTYGIVKDSKPVVNVFKKMRLRDLIKQLYLSIYLSVFVLIIIGWFFWGIVRFLFGLVSLVSST
jgi:hypothetical protein